MEEGRSRIKQVAPSKEEIANRKIKPMKITDFKITYWEGEAERAIGDAMGHMEAKGSWKFLRNIY